MATNVFSDYELKEIGVKFEDAAETLMCECVGSGESEMNIRTITKKCRGVVKKTIIKPDGTGTVKYSLHMPWEFYVQAFGMEDETLKDGVVSYGIGNKHKKFTLTEHIFDEDDNEKFRAFPNCVVQTGKTTKTTNGEEEVAESEIEIAVSPDEFGKGVYEALASELTDATVKTKWMAEFTPALVQKSA